MNRNMPPNGMTLMVLGITAGLLIVMVLAADGDGKGSPSLDNDLGEHISWHTLDNGLARAKQENKPLMLIIHKSWCGACKSLKPKFRSSQKIAELSKKFIMVNTIDDDEPPGDLYRPDGGYVPRLLFFDPEGELLSEIINEEGNPQYKYYYYDELSIATSMEKVAALFPTALEEDINETDESSADHEKVKSEL